MFHDIYPGVVWPQTPTTLRIVIWNVWYRAKAHKVLATLRSLDADVLLLQELTTSSVFNPGVNMPELIATELGYDVHYQQCRQFGRKGRECFEGSAICSRWPLLHTANTTKLSTGGRAPLKGGQAGNRYLLEARITAADLKDSFTVGLAHLSYCMPLGFNAEHLEQERYELMRHLSDRAHRYVFGGDFNALPNSDVVAAVGTQLRPIGPPLDQPSWGLGTGKFSKRYDYAFASPDLTATARFGQRGPSDHRPIIVKLQLNPAPEKGTN